MLTLVDNKFVYRSWDYLRNEMQEFQFNLNKLLSMNNFALMNEWK